MRNPYGGSHAVQRPLFDPAGEANGYLVHPGANKVGVVVLQEWWGLVPHIKDVASRFASAGFVALAPDLYHGKSTVDAEEASHLMKGLDWGRASQEIAGAVAHLRNQEGCSRVAIVGFCMGGALTVIAATQPGVDAYAAFYGFPPSGAANLDTIQIPGLIFFGEKRPSSRSPTPKPSPKSSRAAASPPRRLFTRGWPRLLQRRPPRSLPSRSRQRLVAPHPVAV